MELSGPCLIRAKLLTLAETGLAIVTCGVSRKPPALLNASPASFISPKDQSPLLGSGAWD